MIIATRVGLTAVAGFVMLLLAFELYAVIVDRTLTAGIPSLFGNTEAARSVLTAQSPKDNYSFAIVGDTKSTGTFEGIIKGLREQKPDFAVILGDFVRNGTVGDHRYFRSECQADYALDCPVLLVVGNHDVDRAAFPLARFEAEYGPTVFTFEYQRSLFVVLRTLQDDDANEASLDLLRSLRDRDRSAHDRVFVFMHIAPPVVEAFKGRSYAASGEIATLLAEIGADYAFAGDFHGYARATVGPTNYVVSGGGGADLKEGQFHHAVVVSVEGDRISERFVHVAAEKHYEDASRHIALARFLPWAKANVALVVLLNILCVASLALIRRLWPSSPRAQPS